MIPVDCKYWKQGGAEYGICQIASVIADKEASIPKNACDTCIRQTRPKQLNRVTVSVAARAHRENPELSAVLVREYYRWLMAEGPGTEMYYIIHDAGYELEKGCLCLSTIARMNRNGPEWCLGDGRAEIITSLIEEFSVRHPIMSGLVPQKFVSSQANEWLEQAVANFQRNLSEHES